MLARSAKALFTGLIDYAGLFPPAELPMDEAVRRYDAYRQGEYAWMLGRFIVPEQRVSEVPNDFPLSVLGVDEVKAASESEIEAIGNREAFVEVSDLALIDVLARRGLRAKLRTGGVTAEAFPAVQFVAAFITHCAERHVPFKATAGLHHPVRCVRPLTYAADSPSGTMHGFVNLFMAAALIDPAAEILAEEDPRAFHFDDDFASWRDHAIGTEDLERVRREFALSFGSCSFEEPVAELRELGWL
jgi:hypothetical protein